MADATVAKFNQFVVEVEWVASSGTYARWCGLTSRGMNRSNNLTTTPVPDCDDESLPAANQKDVESQDFSISGSGVWSQESHENAMDWFYEGSIRSVRIQHVNASSGDTEYETGSAILSQLNHAVDKGGKVSAEIEIQFDGRPARTAKA